MNHNIGNVPPSPQYRYFVVEIGPNSETVESYMTKVFAAMGLNTPEKIKAYDNYLRRSFKINNFFQEKTNDARKDQAIVAALRNIKREKTPITIRVFPEVIEHLKSFGINLLVNSQGKATFSGYTQFFDSNFKEHLKSEEDFKEAKATPIAQWTLNDKLTEVIKRAALLLPEHVGKELLALLQPLALAIMAGVVAVWAVSHFFGAGWIADAALLIIGVISIGPMAWKAGEHLITFAIKTVNAVNEEDLDEAAEHLSEAIALIGVQVVMALLLKKAPKVFREPSVELGKPVTRFTFKNIGEPPTSSKLFFESYEGKLDFGENIYAGTKAPGATSQWGDIFITYGKNTPFKEIELTYFHERIHRFLTPKLQLFKSLRQFNAILKKNSYLQSYILRYLEEALAETVAQVVGNGWRNFFLGIKFPFGSPGVPAYVSVVKIGEEAVGILLGPINVGGMTYNVYVSVEED